MISIPRNPLQLVAYAFRALAKDQVPLQQLIFFISFDLRQMPPSRVEKIIQDLHSKGQVEIQNDIVTLSEEPNLKPEGISSISQTELGDLLRVFVSSSRLSRAVGMNDQVIDLKRVSQDPLKIEAIVHGSQVYDLVLDESKKLISHNCPDWQRVSVLHRFCKHVAKLFLLIKNDEAVRILRNLQHESWTFELI